MLHQNSDIVFLLNYIRIAGKIREDEELISSYCTLNLQMVYYDRLRTFHNATKCSYRAISKSSPRVMEQNRKYLSATISAKEYCGRQGTALRRHWDNGPQFDDKGSNENRGNFKWLMKLKSEFNSKLSVLKMFQFLSWIFGHVQKWLD